MRIKITSIIAVASILGYIAAIGIGAYRVYGSVNEQARIAGEEFYSLLDRASAVASEDGFMSESLKATLRDLIIGSQTLQGLIITGPFGNEFSFERERGRIISWTADVPRFKARFGISHEPFYEPLSIEGVRNVTASAAASYIHYPSLINTLKLSFIIITASLILSFTAFMADILTTPRHPAPILPKGGLKNKTGKGAPKQKIPPEEDIDFDEPISGLPREGEARDSPAEAALAGSGVQAGSSPALSPAARESLASALQQSASSNQDLVFMMMEISESGEVFRRLKEKALAFFPPPALVFEQGEQGLTVIIPDRGLEQGFAGAEEFHRLIIEAFPGILIKKEAFRIGLSARTGRQVSPERIAREASRALGKTLEDGAPIVAFKSDPEKYRAFLDRYGG